MNKRNLKQLKKILTQNLTDLLQKTDCNLDGLKELDDNLSDLLDRASHIAERDFSHQLCSREKLHFRQVERALQAIEDDVYGICERCEEEISFKRLKVRPTARYCIQCKTEIEKMEKLTGMEAS